MNQSRTVNQDISDDFLINHISGSFVEMVLWWIKGGMEQTPEELDYYFRSVIRRYVKYRFFEYKYSDKDELHGKIFAGVDTCCQSAYNYLRESRQRSPTDEGCLLFCV